MLSGHSSLNSILLAQWQTGQFYQTNANGGTGMSKLGEGLFSRDVYIKKDMEVKYHSHYCSQSIAPNTCP